MAIVQRVPDAETNPHFGKRPQERTWQELIQNGIVVIDKPAGPTSHQVSAYVQQILHIDKAGHSGTLDPNVTGVLVTGLGEATKVVQHLLTSGKEYICIMHLHKAVPEYDVRRVTNEFLGKINQLPPVKSAVKRQLRERTIYELKILEISGQDVLFVVSCQAGTYVRKLCHDIGRALGVGGHMAALRRTRVAHFTEAQAVPLQDLTDAYVYATKGDPSHLLRILRPVEEGVAHMKQITVLDSAINALTHGVQLKVPGIASYDDTIEAGDQVAVYSLKGELVLTGEAKLDGKRLGGTSGFAVKTTRVYLNADTYPRMQ
jgi:H/ACA ribonucleoprotein complex subunit 4